MQIEESLLAQERAGENQQHDVSCRGLRRKVKINRRCCCSGALLSCSIDPHRGSAITGCLHQHARFICCAHQSAAVADSRHPLVEQSGGGVAAVVTPARAACSCSSRLCLHNGAARIDSFPAIPAACTAVASGRPPPACVQTATCSPALTSLPASAAGSHRKSQTPATPALFIDSRKDHVTQSTGLAQLCDQSSNVRRQEARDETARWSGNANRESRRALPQ